MRDGRTNGPDDGSRTLRTERLTPSGIEAAAEFLPRTVFPSSEPFDAVAACRSLLSANSMLGIAISRVRTEIVKVIGIGAAVFVSDAAAREIRLDLVPGAGERTLCCAASGAVLRLDSRELRARNADPGLNVFIVLHHHEAGLTVTEQQQVRGELTAAFLNDMRGYHLREVLAEVWDDEMDWAVSRGGFRIRNTYGDWYQTHPDTVRRRLLVGLDRTEAMAMQGAVLELLFHYQSPRLGLTASQRRLLAEAVQHKTDAEIAGQLRVSLSAVKKTWAAVFQQAATVLGGFDEFSASPDAAATRGLQKRHKLLAYVRDHPEELKP